MSDLPKGMELSDWLLFIITSMVSGVGTAMAWFRTAKKKMYERIAEMEGKISMHTDLHAKTATDMALLHLNQDHITERLEEIKETTARTRDTLDEVLIEVRSRKRP